MKTILLAGGFGTRISEETHLRPKPMVEIGDYPILWHIMKGYSYHGFNEFVVACGYKGYYIKEYFANYFLHKSNVTFDLSNNKMDVHNSKSEPWKISLIDTGVNTMTGGRVKRLRDFVGDTFLLTYGDGVSNVNIAELVKFHKSHGKLATVTAVQPSGRFGALEIDKNTVKSFMEKPKGDGAWINGGFFVCDKKVIDYISADDTVWEKDPLENLASDGQLMAFHHRDFWKPMDTLRDRNDLIKMWETGNAKWKVWTD